MSIKLYKWSPELAYALGLIATDGNLSKDQRHIDFTSKDISLVKTFKKCLNLNNKIGVKYGSKNYIKKRYYRVQFSDTHFYRWLEKIGFTYRKSKTIANLNIPKKYFRDFLRGHLDGDGDIVTYKDYYNISKNSKYIYDRIYIRFRSASKKHALWIRENISKQNLLKGSFFEQKTQRKDQTTSIWTLRFAKKESIKLIYWLYYKQKLPCLMRKRKIAEKFLSI